jgi:hypothetical protein
VVDAHVPVVEDVAQKAAGPVVRRAIEAVRIRRRVAVQSPNCVHAHTRHLHRFARADPDDAVGRNAERLHERRRREESRRRRRGGDPGQALAVEVVEVVMGDGDQVDPGRLAGRERRLHEPVGVRRQERIDQDGRAAEPEHKARLAEPAQLHLAHPRSFPAAARIESTIGA